MSREATEHLFCSVNLPPCPSRVWIKTNKNFLSMISDWKDLRFSMTLSWSVFSGSCSGRSTAWSLPAWGKRNRIAKERKSRYGRLASEIWTRSAKSVWSSVKAVRGGVEVREREREREGEIEKDRVWKCVCVCVCVCVKGERIAWVWGWCVYICTCYVCMVVYMTFYVQITPNKKEGGGGSVCTYKWRLQRKSAWGFCVRT